MSDTSWAHSKGNRILTFSLAAEEFGIPLLSVREVMRLPEFTPVPQSPLYFLGLMNLRGQVLSAIDLRLKLGMKAERNAETAIIICDFQTTQIGVVVDSINRVITIDPTRITEPSSIRSTHQADYILGVYREQEKLVLMLDLPKVLSLHDARFVQGAVKAAG